MASSGSSRFRCSLPALTVGSRITKPNWIEISALMLANLKRNLVHRGNTRQFRVVPQIQNSNLRDFEYILGRRHYGIHGCPTTHRGCAA